MPHASVAATMNYDLRSALAACECVCVYVSACACVCARLCVCSAVTHRQPRDERGRSRNLLATVE